MLGEADDMMTLVVVFGTMILPRLLHYRYHEVGNWHPTIFEKYQFGFWEKKEKNRGNKWKMNRRGTS